jgi:hypothetical protein
MQPILNYKLMILIFIKLINIENENNHINRLF